MKIWTYSSSRSSKVIDFLTNRKRICDFLLVINSNFGPVLHRFWDTATYWLKISYFSYPSLIQRPAPIWSLWNFAVKLTMKKLESWGWGYALWWKLHDPNRFWLIHPCDRRTDRQPKKNLVHLGLNFIKIWHLVARDLIILLINYKQLTKFEICMSCV